MLIILTVLVIAALAVGLWLALRTTSKHERGGPPAQPHEPGHVGSRETV
jgi:hypothetical protein